MAQLMNLTCSAQSELQWIQSLKLAANIQLHSCWIHPTSEERWKVHMRTRMAFSRAHTTKAQRSPYCHYTPFKFTKSRFLIGIRISPNHPHYQFHEWAFQLFFIKILKLFSEKTLKMLFICKQKSEKEFLDPPLIGICTKSWWVLPWPFPYPSTKFHRNLSFIIYLFFAHKQTNKPTNKQTGRQWWKQKAAHQVLDQTGDFITL